MYRVSSLYHVVTWFYYYSTLDWFEGDFTGTSYINHGENLVS